MAEHIQISIVVPVYNDEADIVCCIQSIYNQTRLPFEVIVVDDGSTDSTVDIIRSAGFGGIRLFTALHNGVAAARNIGISRANGSHIMFLDSDDELEPRAIELIELFYLSHPDVAAVGGQSLEQTSGASWSVVRRPLDSGSIYKELPFRNPIVQSGFTIKKEVFSRIGLYNTSLWVMQDYQLWLRMRGYVLIRNLDEVIVKRKFRQESHTRIGFRSHFYISFKLKFRLALSSGSFALLIASIYDLMRTSGLQRVIKKVFI